MNTVKLNLLKKIYVGILLVIFGGIVLHAPISVGLRVLIPGFELIFKSWKEILMFPALILAIYLVIKTKQTKIFKSPIAIAIIIYSLLHLFMVAFFTKGPILSVLAGLIIDLRYILFFGLVYVAISLFPDYRKLFIKVGIIGALIVCLFAILQVTILPKDFLEIIGYSQDTISPYLLVDKNHNFVRIISTMRGPNPLGAYAGIVISLVLAYVIKYRMKIKKQSVLIASLLLIGGATALLASYSRSALIGALVSAAIIFVTAVVPKLSKKQSFIGLVSFIIISAVCVIFLIGNPDFTSNVLFHENINDQSSQINSNEEHLGSIKNGLIKLANQPFGAGVGSTGSASLYTDKPEIIENQFLFVAHETGWLGLILFVGIIILIMSGLWKLRSDWLALGVFASGVGLIIIGLLLPVWVDDTVSIIWWGLAAVALLYGSKDYNGKNKRIY